MDRRLLILGALALAVLSATPAQARRFRLPRGAGLRGATKTYGANHLTQAQLEECLIQGRDLDELEGILGRNEGDLTKKQATLEQQYERLDDEGRRVDQYSQASVDAYNASVSHYQAAQNEFNAAVDQHNAGLQHFNSGVNGYNASCADRLYYEDDMDAARLAVGVTD